ncbi:MAG: tetratricopeptide repeat protein [Bacteroidota bacterium]
MMNFPKRAGRLLCILLFFYAHFVTATITNYEFSFSKNCIDAQKNISILKLDKARAILINEHKQNPQNTFTDYLDDYIDYYTLITNQQLEELHKLEKNKTTRIDRIKNADQNSPYFLYTQAEINLHWALSRTFNQEFITAAFEFRTAYQLLTENSKKYPSFAPNKKSLGMLKAVLGTIPDNFKWILNVIGMKGNFNEGLKDIKLFLDQKNLPQEQEIEKQSAEFYYTFLLLNFGEKKDCWKFCESVTGNYETNLLSSYLRAFAGIKCAHNDDAINACIHRPKGNEYTPFYMMEYFTGVAKLNKLDKDAEIYFKKFVTFYKGQNFVKDAYKRLSWYYILEGDTLKFTTYRGLAGKYGALNSDEDKNAQKESAAGIYPNTGILKARLLFDGGYYMQAEEMMQNIKLQDLKTDYQKIEYYYRYGRIMHESNKIAKAIELYKRTIDESDISGNYFAPNSCLQLGLIYEKLGYKNLAIQYLEKALAYKNYEYKSGITQKVKAALNNLEQ